MIDSPLLWIDAGGYLGLDIDPRVQAMEAEGIADTAHEGIHPPGPQTLWSESWYFDFAARDGSAGGFVRLGTYPMLGLSWWWAYVVGRVESAPVVAGEQLERPLGADRSGAFHLEDPELAGHIQRVGTAGLRLSSRAAEFAFDVEWRGTAEPHHYRRGSRYEQAGWAEGTVTVGCTTQAFEGPGQRDHSWGVRDWWRFGWTWCAGWLSDGERFQATQLDARGRVDPDGYILSPAGSMSPVRCVQVDTLPDDKPIELRLDGRSLILEDVATMTLNLVAPDGRSSQLIRSMTIVRSPDGRHGVGWRERNVPAIRRPVSHSLLRGSPT
jgi:hypothetical protein